MIRSAFRWLVDYMHDSWHFITALFERMDKIHMGLIAAGVDLKQACRAAIVSPLSDEPTLVGAMRDLVDLTFA